MVGPYPIVISSPISRSKVNSWPCSSDVDCSFSVDYSFGTSIAPLISMLLIMYVFISPPKSQLKFE